MKPRILEIADKLNLHLTFEQAESFANEIIDECIYAILMNYEGKMNPVALKEMIDDQLGTNQFYFNPNGDVDFL